MFPYLHSGLRIKGAGWSRPAEIRKFSSLWTGGEILISQRLNTGDLILAWLVGFVEGDGWFSISKKGKYLTYEFGIELSIRDVQLIYKIKDLLGIGVFTYRKTQNRSQTVIFRVRNKSHLKEIILPIFEKYPLISNKQYDFLRFKKALLSDIIYYNDLDNDYIRPLEPLNSVETILSLPYFSSWLVGFIEAEGCFSIYSQSSIDYKSASFDIGQTNGELVILAISKYLSFTQKINKDKTNCFKLKVSSIRSIENVIDFIQKAPIKLMGYKKLQYLLWLKELRHINRYSKKFHIPDIY